MKRSGAKFRSKQANLLKMAKSNQARRFKGGIMGGRRGKRR